MMTRELYDDIMFWLDGSITEEERKEIIYSIYSGDEEKIHAVLNRITWNHLGIERA